MSWKDVAALMEVRVEQLQDKNKELTEQNKLLEQKVEHLQGELNRAPCKERNKNLIQMNKVDSENKLLRAALNIMVEYAEVCDKVLESTIGSFERGTAIPMAKDLLEQTKCLN